MIGLGSNHALWWAGAEAQELGSHTVTSDRCVAPFFFQLFHRAAPAHAHRGLEIKRQTLQFARKRLSLTHSVKPMSLGRHATLHLPHRQCYLHFRALSRPSISQIRNETCNTLHTPHTLHFGNLLPSSP